MRALFFCLGILFIQSVYAQTFNYDAGWKKVDELVKNRNLPASALEEVNRIYQAAKKEKNDAQLIKALVYMTDLRQETREDHFEKAISEIRKEIASSREPATSLLESMLAGVYLKYLQQNRHRFYDRTAISGFSKDDINTWTLEDLHREISGLYLQSVSPQQILRRTSIEAFQPLLIRGNTPGIRPTLYDLLVHRALAYFRNDERDITRPAYAFEISQAAAFSPAPVFVKADFSTRDSLSLKQKAILLYQELLAFHLNDANPAALLDADLHRLRFVYAHSTHPLKDSLYSSALEQLISRYRGHAGIKQAAWLLALFYIEQDDMLVERRDTSRKLRVVADSILQQVVRDSAVKNEGWTNAYNLLQQLRTTELSFQVEKVNIPGKPFRVLTGYKNLERVYFRIVKADAALKKQLEELQDGDRFWNILLRAKPVRSWSQPLPQPGDFRKHHAEVKVDALPPGEYFLLAAENAQPGPLHMVAAGNFHISSISYIRNMQDLFVLHRETGQPLAGAVVYIYRPDYDSRRSVSTKTLIGSFATDSRGYIRVPEREESRYSGYYIEISHGEERFSDENLNYSYYYDRRGTETVHTHIHFFTDRSIYRPGQAVYFKGIAVSKAGRDNNIAANYQTRIYLRDANYQVRDSMDVSTNEYGSFSGIFQLPSGLLNGGFSIVSRDGNSRVAFSVEEYKRPGFSVEFEKISEAYRVGDTVKISGTARAYAGNLIDNARVVYRVVRQARFPYPWLRGGWFPRIPPMEIAHGESNTDSQGRFTIFFPAIPDRSLDPRMEPVFDYIIHADITNISGETRSATQRISAGYKSLLLQVEVPESMHKDSLRSVTLRTVNMNNEFQASIVTVTLTRLIPPGRLIRERYWSQPDQFIMSRQEYLSHFPHDNYNNDKDPATWQKAETAYSVTDSSRRNGIWPFSGYSFSAGAYELVVTTYDREGNEVRTVSYITLHDKLTFPVPEYLVAIPSSPVEPGDTAVVDFGSAAPDIFLIGKSGKNGKDSLFYSGLNREWKQFIFPVNEADRGGFDLSYIFVKHNRVYSSQDRITVPWSNKELKVEFETFRDRILPGSAESWKVRISGRDRDRLAAELLLSMYDASLDQFRAHEWNIPSIWPLASSPNRWDWRGNFTGKSSDQRWIPSPSRMLTSSYDRLALTVSEFLYRDYSGFNDDIAPMRGNLFGVREKRGEELQQMAAPVDAMNAAVAEHGDGTPDRMDQEAIEPTGDPVREAPQVRRNFNETAFFFPHLRTDAEGNVEFSFTAPEALTRWKMQAIAHTADLAFGKAVMELVTQKELMVQPNMPRFLRQGDQMEFAATIANISEKELTGQAQLQLFDAASGQPVDGWFINSFPGQYFTVAQEASTVVRFPIQVPYDFNGSLVWRITARSGNISDAEENLLPVLSNKILVTETLPLHVKAGSRDFEFKKLVESGGSETLQHQSLTVEFTANPVWLAVQALPYLMEFPYECSEQVWNRYYANALASHIVSRLPRIRQVFEKWQAAGSNADERAAALMSNLERNQELKSVLLEETPWVMQALDEAAQRKNIALLFDLVRMDAEKAANLEKLRGMQMPGGGFVWFRGGPEDRYITQYIVTGIGHLRKLGIPVNELMPVVRKAMPYLDRKAREEYELLVRNRADLSKMHISSISVQYLYMRSFFPEIQVPANTRNAYAFYRGQAQQHWMRLGTNLRGMIALALQRTGDESKAGDIRLSLLETSILNEELGRYWKSNAFGISWRWESAPIETHAMMIEVFAEIKPDNNIIDELRTWLLKHKQTNSWRTTKATADACYALLLRGSDWLMADAHVQIRLGDTVFASGDDAEAGSGYFKRRIEGAAVKPEMGRISVTVQPTESSRSVNPPGNRQQSGRGSAAPGWGAVYWQYFEDMDRVTMAETPLSLRKQLSVQRNTDRGPVLTPLREGSMLQVGDRVVVRIELRVDREMEYVHMKDMRASSLEPVNVISSYKWQGGLGYYETTKDASTNFFFNRLGRGTYVFEYTLYVTHAGTFSNGITTIQCMYAPEFTSHSEGLRIHIEQQ